MAAAAMTMAGLGSTKQLGRTGLGKSNAVDGAMTTADGGITTLGRAGLGDLGTTGLGGAEQHTSPPIESTQQWLVVSQEP